MKNLILAAVAAFPLMSGAVTRLPEENLYSARIDSVVDVESIGRGDALNATLVLQQEIPNSDATVLISGLSGKKPYWVLHVLTNQTDPEGKPTKKIAVQFSPSAAGVTVDQLPGHVLQLLSLRQDVTITSVVDRGQVGERDFHNADITLSAFVPNQQATLIVDSQRITALSATTLPEGMATNTLEIQVREKVLAKLKGKAVRLYTPELPVVRLNK